MGGRFILLEKFIMPIMRCTRDGMSGFKWGPNGYCYIGPGARARAERQGRAILASGGKQRFEPPPAGDAPEEVQDILSTVYNQCRQDFHDSNPELNPEGDNSRVVANRTRCARISWGAVRQAGWRKIRGRWAKR